jgi:large subunit ribosomal protein L13
MRLILGKWERESESRRRPGQGNQWQLTQTHIASTFIGCLKTHTNVGFACVPPDLTAGLSALRTFPEMKTYSATPTDIKHQWFIVDASGMVLGRLAAEVAKIIRGKHKPMYTPHMDTGDNVIVINASKVKVTGKKADQKRYFHHTGYMGHERFTPFAAMLEKHPERVIEKAVYGMLPKTALGRQSLRRKLRVFANANHTHAAQQPKVLEFKKKSETK